MEILDTIVNREINEIKNSPAITVAHRWVLVIRANGKEIKPVFIRDVQLDRLYQKNYGDELTISAGFIFSDYQFNILPYKDTLEATLTYVPLDNNANAEVNQSLNRRLGSYKVQLMNANSDSVSGDNPLTLNKAMADKADLFEATFQLINISLDYLRKKTYGTVIRDTAPIDTVCYVLMKYGNYEGADQQNRIIGCSVDPTFTKDIRAHTLIRQNSRVVDIPMLVDKQVGGIHPAQMHFYLQNQYWYIYPLFDHTRFDTATESITVIKIPKFRLPSIEKTFRIKDNHVIILSTDSTSHHDNSESQILNSGNGVRFVDSTGLMDGYAKTGDNKLVVDAKQNVTEVMFNPREDGSDMITAPSSVITNDYNRTYAQLAAKSGSYIQTIWQHAYVEVIKPGMAVRYIFQDGDVTRELYGVLHAIETLDYNTNNTFTNPRFVTTALLTLFVSSVSPLKNTQTVDSTKTTTT